MLTLAVATSSGSFSKREISPQQLNLSDKKSFPDLPRQFFAFYFPLFHEILH